jgi:hypothetical protein
MRLTWKDGMSTLFMAAIAAAYVAFLNGTSMWLISSARGTITAVLVLGIVGGCALGAAGSLYSETLSRPARIYRAIASALGLIALTAAVAGLITGSEVMLAILFGATMALWLIATARHAFTAPPASPANRDQHEVIDHEVIGQDATAVRR